MSQKRRDLLRKVLKFFYSDIDNSSGDKIGLIFGGIFIAIVAVFCFLAFYTDILPDKTAISGTAWR